MGSADFEAKRVNNGPILLKDKKENAVNCWNAKLEIICQSAAKPS